MYVEKSNFFLKKNFIYVFLGRGEGKDKERERKTDVLEKHWLPFTRLQLGTQPATQACALTGNQTSDLLDCRLVLSSLSHTSQGYLF